MKNHITIFSMIVVLLWSASAIAADKVVVIPLPSHTHEVKLLEAKVVELETVLATRMADLEAALAAIDALVSANAQDILSNENGIADNGGDISTNIGNIASNSAAITGNATNILNNGQQIAAVESTVTDQGTAIATLEDSEVMDLEPYISVDSSNKPTVILAGVNLQVVSGSGSTHGALNGLGNLIVGYNELRGAGDVRTGSHNLVIGQQNNYSGYGGLVAGYYNNISNTYATVSAGRYNQAIGAYSSVSAGSNNTASSLGSSVSGGQYNRALGAYSSVNGGRRNGTNADYSSILGGSFVYTGDVTYDVDGFIVFGVDHTIGSYSTVSGGLRNYAKGAYSAVIGGSSLTVTSDYGFANPYHP
jgi:hypothetical protein